VHNLEHIIAAVRKGFEEETAQQAHALEQTELELRTSRECESGQQEQIHALHAEQAAVRAAGAAQTDEALVYATGVQSLRAELEEEEGERRAARGAEACALSVAGTYREFAMQGVARLDRMETELEATRQRLEARLAGVGASATAALRQRALRAVLGAAASRACQSALVRWAATVVSSRRAEAEAERVSAAVRRETQRKVARGLNVEAQMRAERAISAEALLEARKQVEGARQEASRFEAVAASAEERRQGAEEREQKELAASLAQQEALRSQLAEARAALGNEQEAHGETMLEKQSIERALRDERKVAAERVAREEALVGDARGLTQTNEELRAELDHLHELSLQTRYMDMVADTLLHDRSQAKRLPRCEVGRLGDQRGGFGNFSW